MNANSFLPGRGKNYCRGCNNPTLFSALDLGDLPIANELWQNENEKVELFPLHLRICAKCGLGQVEDVVTPERLFRDYRYLSSMSASFIEHARAYAIETAKLLEFKKGDWVLEIASNDGYLLQHFIELGIEVLGVEPAENVAKIAIEAGIPTISEFFGLEIAQSLLDTRGYPKLIVANNVMAHVPAIRDFIEGLAKLAGPATLISIENPSLMNFLAGDQFDTIYHEHFSYLTAHAVHEITKEFKLELFNVEHIETHGGSNRYWLRTHSGEESLNAEVRTQIKREIDDGLFDQSTWSAFDNRVKKTIIAFHNWMRDSFEKGRVVCGYGAAAKASTLLNASGIKREWIAAIADASHEKQGRFMPTEAIPIISPTQMFEMKPSDIVIFPWNISNELVKIINQGIHIPTQIWRAIPYLELVR